MAGAGNWRSGLGVLLDAVPPEKDPFVLELLTQQDADGDLFKGLLPDDTLQRMDNEYGDYWWVNADAPQSEAWINHRWRVLRADSDTRTITIARML